jgi:hypothetical protein
MLLPILTIDLKLKELPREISPSTDKDAPSNPPQTVLKEEPILVWVLTLILLPIVKKSNTLINIPPLINKRMLRLKKNLTSFRMETQSPILTLLRSEMDEPKQTCSRIDI